MKLLLRRSQKSGMLGGTKYTLYVRAQLSEEESSLVKHNHLAGELLVYHERDTGPGLFSAAKSKGGLTDFVVSKMRDTELTVAKLIEGAELSCENVAQLLAVEDQVKGAALTLKAYLDAAAKFGGEEVLDMDEVLAQVQGRT